MSKTNIALTRIPFMMLPVIQNFVCIIVTENIVILLMQSEIDINSEFWKICHVTGRNGLDKIEIRSTNEKSSFEIYLFGATLTSWINNEQELIFVSENAVYDGVKAIRGGIPLVFPQFAQPSSALPQHGFARTSNWSYKSFHSTDLYATLILSLSDNPSTINMWPYRFSLIYSITLSASSLNCEFKVINNDSEKFSCQTLFHTYFAVPSIDQVEVSALYGFPYIDKVQQNKLIENNAEEKIRITSETDRIYSNTASYIPDIILKRSNQHNIKISKQANLVITSDVNENSPVNVDVVVWNPWIDKAKQMSDLGETSYPHFICIEPGIVTHPVELPPGASLIFSQTLTPF